MRRGTIIALAALVLATAPVGTPPLASPLPKAQQTPAAETPAAETPAAETPAAETSAAGTPAAGTPAPNAKVEKLGLLSIGVGWYDWNDDKDAVDLRLEYRSPHEALWRLKPWIGLEGTTDGAVYGVAGMLVDIFFGRRLVLTPSFGGGLYADGGGKDLGHVVEFRSQLELGYRFDDRSRLSVAVSHISNASLDDNNPGTEVATIYYHMPIRSIFGE